jgi:hypothetical protein
MKGAPYVSSINSMAFGGDGVLYAVNSNLGTPAKTRLVAIDVKSGEVKDVMGLPDDVDSLTFGPAVGRDGNTEAVRNRHLAIGGIGAFAGFVLGLASGLAWRRKRRPVSDKAG